MLYDYSDFAEPLIDMIFVATKDVRRMSTNGRCIYFDPDWLKSLSCTSLDFALCHQLMHIELGHIDRPSLYRGERFHLACDIVANARLREFGWTQEALPGIGSIRRTTYLPELDGGKLTAEEAFGAVPFDPAALSPGKQRSYMNDCEDWWNRQDDRGEGGEIILRPGDADPDDIGIVRDDAKRPFIPKYSSYSPLQMSFDGAAAELEEPEPPGIARASEDWESSHFDTIDSLKYIKARAQQACTSLDPIARVWKRTDFSRLNWIELLSVFIQEEVRDYSFSPPDRRYSDEPFFLPDFNVPETFVKNVLFMVDTSGSVDENKLAAAYTELCAAIEQFGGSLSGSLCFFDTRVHAEIEFASVADIAAAIPQGGGGTDLKCIFDYAKKRLHRAETASLVIFTDGAAEFPPEEAAGSIPVLWLIAGSEATAPWGRMARI